MLNNVFVLPDHHHHHRPRNFFIFRELSGHKGKRLEILPIKGPMRGYRIALLVLSYLPRQS
jgi:hypothetical protein